MTEPSKMPARIWCDSIDADVCRMRFRPSDTAYIRADIAEQMASVLKAIRSEMNAGLGSSYGETREQVRRALSAWEASNA